MSLQDSMYYFRTKKSPGPHSESISMTEAWGKLQLPGTEPRKTQALKKG